MGLWMNSLSHRQMDEGDCQAWHLGTQAGGRVREGLIRESQVGDKVDSTFLGLSSISERRTLLLPPPLYPLQWSPLIGALAWEEK